MGVLLLLPILLAGAAMIAAVVCVRMSTLRITTAGVEIRNYPQATRVIALSDVDRFEATPSVGNFKSLRPETAVLVLTDGTRVPVRKVTAPDAGVGVPALNDRVQSLRG